MIQRLVYRSAPLAPPDGAILDIVRAAERHNARLGCSGMLFYGLGTYAQLIEGPQAGVAELWERIAADRRHRLLWRRQGPAPRREIEAGLPMGYLSEREARSDPVYAGIVELLATDVCAAPGGPERAPGLGHALAEAARRKYPSHCLGRAI